jgi:hypothetical protein
MQLMPLLRAVTAAWRVWIPALAAALLSLPALAGVLPEDRADVLYHRYQGGGITIQGPSVLIRKKIGDSLSVPAGWASLPGRTGDRG